MSEINNLAEIIGLGTNNKYVNNMPFARAANTELNLAVQEQRAEKARKEAEKKLNEQIAARVKGDPKGLDDIGAKIYNQSYVNTINQGGVPEAVYAHNEVYAKQKAESDALQSISNTADKLLLPEDIKNAYKKRDYEYIKQKAKENPNLGITISESGRPLIDPSKIVAEKNIDDYFSDIAKIFSKEEGNWKPLSGKVERKFDKVYQKAILDPQLIKREADNIFTTDPRQSEQDQILEKNYLVKREKEIAQELSKPQYAQIGDNNEKLIAAAKNVFMAEANKKLVKEIDATPRKRSEDKDYRWSGNTFTNGKGNSWTYTYDPNTKAIGVNTVGNTGVSPQGLLLARKSTNKQGVEKIDNPDYADVKIMAITPIGNNTWEVTASESGIPVKGIATDEALTSYMSNFPAEKIREGYKARVGGFPIQTPNIEVKQTPKSNWESPIKEAPKAESEKKETKFKGLPTSGKF